MTDSQAGALLGERSRLMIMAALAAASDGLSFSDLLGGSGLTRGNLSVHVRKLEEAGLVAVQKEFRGRKPHTTYRCTEKGRRELCRYLEQIEALLKGLKAAEG
jgi:DNA-binding transcriptional ArsR family regulator